MDFEREIALIRNSSQPHILHSLAVIRNIFRQFGPAGVAFSFNGGKDSTIALHLVRAVLDELKEEMPTEGLKSICVIYFSIPNQFPDVEAFMEETSKKYDFSIITINGSYKEGLQHLLQTHPLHAIIMGQRKIDPEASRLEEVSPTDPGWPQFLRVNPILNWTYDEVWQFLKSNNLSYCTLYDQGYTSLGSTQDTLPNPALRTAEGTYLPADQLHDDLLERAGRIPKTPKSASTSTSSLSLANPQN
eukprot:TRINITY_DN1651_c0_g1_i3.p1 TRINITY_DN1651_c0_g1~~TRINITY_DN1651_c0_g1_i3.p1  ORF type:complete len:246 (+),score=33.96 TRINITY_DN1651_c0_g1_i3:89-826(+)